MQLRTTGLGPGKPAVTFQRHIGQVARASTHVDLLEQLLQDAKLLDDDADARSGEPLDPDACFPLGACRSQPSAFRSCQRSVTWLPTNVVSLAGLCP